MYGPAPGDQVTVTVIVMVAANLPGPGPGPAVAGSGPGHDPSSLSFQVCRWLSLNLKFGIDPMPN